MAEQTWENHIKFFRPETRGKLRPNGQGEGKGGSNLAPAWRIHSLELNGIKAGFLCDLAH